MRLGARSTLAAVYLFLNVVVWSTTSSGDDPAPGPRPQPHPPLALTIPDSQLGIRTAPLLLLSRPDLRADVGLDARQSAEVELAIAEIYTRALALKGKTGRAADLARKAIDEDMQRWLNNHLSQPQRDRLLQIDLQWEGPSALVSRPIIAETLFLTNEQRKALGQAVAECKRKRLSGTFQLSDEHALARQALAILNEEQQLRWKAMLGHRMGLAPQVAGNRK